MSWRDRFPWCLNGLRTVVLGMVILFCGFSRLAMAQSDEDENLDQFEAEIKKSESRPKIQEGSHLTAPQTLKSVTDLSSLAPFSEVGVLQKRWMPKSSRFQVFGGAGVTTNDPWFLTLSGQGKIGYGLSEAIGFELGYISFSSSANNNAKDLESNNGVLTSTFVTPKSFMGVDLMWTPIYGKMTRGNQAITPFDMYFEMGMGQLALANAKKTSTSAFHVGTGQIFAMTRNFGLRWDLSVINYSAESNDGVGGNYNNVLLTIGANYYFPGVSAR